MILSIDVGNTTITCGLFDGDRILFQFRIKTNVNTSSDEIGVFFRSVLRENGFDWKAIEKVGCCSVVPQMNYSIASACSKYLNCNVLFVQGGIKTGLKIKYGNPKEIGADLISAAMGAIALHPGKDIVVVDMGTAITLELITKDKEYLGGTILPGLQISVDALTSQTAKLPAVEIAKPAHICGTTTTEAIQAGLFYGTAGAIKELCFLYERNVFHGKKPFIIGTGGFAKGFKEYGLFDDIMPEMVLFGVKTAIDMNC